jgi:hypothetical protein
MGDDFPNTIGIADGQYMEKIVAMILDVDKVDYESLNLDVAKDSYYYDDILNDNEDETDTGIEPVAEENNNYSEHDYFEEYLEKYIEEIYYEEHD